MRRRKISRKATAAKTGSFKNHSNKGERIAQIPVSPPIEAAIASNATYVCFGLKNPTGARRHNKFFWQ
jgi:hypothetical protein